MQDHWRGHRSRIAVVALATIGALLTPTPAAANGNPPVSSFSGYAVFNLPNDEAHRDRSIENEIIALADAAPSGSYVRAVMYSWSSVPVAEALRRAAARGVVVRVVLDRTGGGTNTSPGNEAVRILESANLDDLAFCGSSPSTVSGSTACVANRSSSINHNKVFTFSTSGARKRVVVVGSQNMTYTQNNYFNNAVMVHEDYDLYDHYVRYFNDLRAERKNNDYYHDDPDGYYKSPTTAVTSYHSPMDHGDVVANTLGYMRDYEAGCAIEVAQSAFSSARQAVADQLLRIARLGCGVRVVHSGMSKSIHDTLSQSGSVSLKKYDDREASNYDGRRVAVHSKYLVVKGNYNGSPGRTIVYTGSQNLTGSGLRRNDETWLKIEQPQISADYRANFATLWSRAKCVNPENGSCLY